MSVFYARARGRFSGLGGCFRRRLALSFSSSLRLVRVRCHRRIWGRSHHRRLLFMMPCDMMRFGFVMDHRLCGFRRNGGGTVLRARRRFTLRKGERGDSSKHEGGGYYHRTFHCVFSFFLWTRPWSGRQGVIGKICSSHCCSRPAPYLAGVVLGCVD